MRRALVTGATGLLGSYIAERLIEDGWSVRGLVRQPTDARWLADTGVALVQGDVHEPASVTEAASDCDALFHAAAVIGVGGRWADFEATNVAGTESAIRAAEATGARLVHVSSTAVYGRSRYGHAPTDERTPLPQLPLDDLYGRSKQVSERAVLAAHEAGRLWATVVRPPVMYGKRDRQFVPRLAPLLRKGVFPRIGDGSATLSVVHADSVADGAVRAVDEAGARGSVFVLANDYELTLTELLELAARGLETRVRTPRVPRWLGSVGARTASSVLGLAGRPDLARLTVGALDMLVRDNPFDSTRARETLGWCPRIPPGRGVPEAFAWWRKHAASPDRAPNPAEPRR